MARTIAVTLFAAVAIFFAGCGTLSDAMCGPIDDHIFYRGVRLDVAAVKEGGPKTLMAADIPFSALADTALLPYATCLWMVSPAKLYEPDGFVLYCEVQPMKAESAIPPSVVPATTLEK
jgi:uncharacterized protein YceK